MYFACILLLLQVHQSAGPRSEVGTHGREAFPHFVRVASDPSPYGYAYPPTAV